VARISANRRPDAITYLVPSYETTEVGASQAGSLYDAMRPASLGVVGERPESVKRSRILGPPQSVNDPDSTRPKRGGPSVGDGDDGAKRAAGPDEVAPEPGQRRAALIVVERGKLERHCKVAAAELAVVPIEASLQILAHAGKGSSRDRIQHECREAATYRRSWTLKDERVWTASLNL
jgi:hypothetical protein